MQQEEFVFSFFLFVRLYFSLVDFLGFSSIFWGRNVDVSLFVGLDSVPYFSFRLLYPIVLSVPFFLEIVNSEVEIFADVFAE